MYESITQTNSEQPLVPKASQEIISDPIIAWHALRGLDLAGLEAMLK